MITVLAENRNNPDKRAVLDLPTQDGKVEKFYMELGTVAEKNIIIKYAGAGELRSTDTLLFENNLNRNPMSIKELNLLGYLLERMDENQIKEYDDTMSEYTNDLGVPGIKSLISEVYDKIAYATGNEAPQYYDGENISECITAERILLKPYSKMNKDIFWQMIDDANQSSGDYKRIGDILTQQLSQMNPQEIILYKDINDQYVKLADRKEIYEAGCKLNYSGEITGLGDDGFTDFRCFLVSQGKDVYMNTMKDPDSVMSANLSPYGDSYTWEGFNYIASYAYTQNTREDLYDQRGIITHEQKDEIKAGVENYSLNQHDQVSELNEPALENSYDMKM